MDKRAVEKHKGIRRVSATIVTDDYLCYKGPKSPYNFILILIFSELFKFKTWDGELFSGLVRISTFSLRSHRDHFAFFTALPRLSDQKISMKCFFILRKLHRARKIFLKIILRPCKINLLM